MFEFQFKFPHFYHPVFIFVFMAASFVLQRRGLMKVPVGNNHSMYDIQADNATTSANYPRFSETLTLNRFWEELKEDRET